MSKLTDTTDISICQRLENHLENIETCGCEVVINLETFLSNNYSDLMTEFLELKKENIILLDSYKQNLKSAWAMINSSSYHSDTKAATIDKLKDFMNIIDMKDHVVVGEAKEIEGAQSPVTQVEYGGRDTVSTYTPEYQDNDWDLV